MLEEHSLTPAGFEAAMKEAGLVDDAYAHPSPDATWPTLGELVARRKRVVVLTEKDPASRPPGENVPPWYHYLWAHAWETPFAFKDVHEFTCEKNRGTKKTNPIYLVNHFVTLIGPSLLESAIANAWPVISERADKCRALAQPTVVAVDFFDAAGIPAPGGAGPTVVAVVDRLNGLGR
jgi:hypothetical protein